MDSRTWDVSKGAWGTRSQTAGEISVLSQRASLRHLHVHPILAALCQTPAQAPWSSQRAGCVEVRPWASQQNLSGEQRRHGRVEGVEQRWGTQRVGTLSSGDAVPAPGPAGHGEGGHQAERRAHPTGCNTAEWDSMCCTSNSNATNTRRLKYLSKANFTSAEGRTAAQTRLSREHTRRRATPVFVPKAGLIKAASYPVG